MTGGDLNAENITVGSGGIFIGSLSKKRAFSIGAVNVSLKGLNTTGPIVVVHQGTFTVRYLYA
ncbi:MAG: hypothetical protein ACK4ON_09245 [Bacteroidia bacterium]